MAPIAAKLDICRGGGPYCFKLHGHTPRYLLIMDSEEAANKLAGREVNRECDRSKFVKLLDKLHTVNPYMYRLSASWMKFQRRRSKER